MSIIAKSFTLTARRKRDNIASLTLGARSENGPGSLRTTAVRSSLRAYAEIDRRFCKSRLGSPDLELQTWNSSAPYKEISRSQNYEST
jgi:hypothetical protein